MVKVHRSWVTPGIESLELGGNGKSDSSGGGGGGVSGSSVLVIQLK